VAPNSGTKIGPHFWNQNRFQKWGPYLLLEPEECVFLGGAVRVFADGGNACSPILSLVAKVCSYLQWAKCARAAAGAKGKLPLFVNMDETSVAYSYGTGMTHAIL